MLPVYFFKLLSFPPVTEASMQLFFVDQGKAIRK